MADAIGARVVGSLALATTIATEVINGIVAFSSITDNELLLALRILLFIAFGFTIAGIISLAYFTILYMSNINTQGISQKSTVWAVYGVGIGVALVTISVSGLDVVWLLIRRNDLPGQLLYRRPSLWIYIWLGMWAASLLLQAVLFVLLGLWTRRTLQKQNLRKLNLDYAVRQASQDTRIGDEHRSLNSRDTTLVSLPITPTNIGSLNRGGSGLKTLATNSRTKLVSRSSARSSFDYPLPPSGEVLTMDAFEQWDTSNMHLEMRPTVVPSLVAQRSALAPIPGSRPDSPANALDAPFEPTSSPPQALSSDTAMPLEWSSPTQTRRSSQNPPSSPPSSPPNFSRPTSRSKPKPLSPPFESSMQELIHPLFRSTSPHPPPIATMGSMVTASPMANDPITPKTLARLRTSTVQDRSQRQSLRPTSKGHWRAMPSTDATSTRPSTAGSTALGSPGPSIADEEELPPILPGFVLGAGSRTSLIGYSSRKSSRKEKRLSGLSLRSD